MAEPEGSATGPHPLRTCTEICPDRQSWGETGVVEAGESIAERGAFGLARVYPALPRLFLPLRAAATPAFLLPSEPA